MKTPKDVDSYIAAAPKEVRVTLTELRRVIKNAAPRASERIPTAFKECLEPRLTETSNGRDQV